MKELVNAVTGYTMNNIMIEPLSEKEEREIHSEVNLWTQSIEYSNKPSSLTRDLINRFNAWIDEYEHNIVEASIRMEASPSQDANKLRHNLSDIIHQAGRNIYFIDSLEKELKIIQTRFDPEQNKTLAKKDLERFIDFCTQTEGKLKEIISTCVHKYHLIDKHPGEKQMLQTRMAQNVH
jgi:hypothetical protein